MQWVYEMATSDSEIALKSLYMCYFEQLIRFTGLYVSSSGEAEELVSDTFLAIWENRRSLLTVGDINAYIYSIARHKAISYFRKQHLDQVSLDDLPQDFFANTDTTPEDDLISQEEISRLNDAINSLPPKCKMAFKLVREDNLKYKEVAAILDISVKTLEAHLATAVKKLREALK
jgi:RNA polymerase sigma-70 factor (ECF subfamily)